MQLVSLKVFRDGNLLREKDFQEGFNIITNSEEDGNQIGKSTALRVINFCLGSDGKTIWEDPETKKNNDSIRELITSGRVTFELNISIRGKTYIINRRIHCLKTEKRTIEKRFSKINEIEFDTNKKFQTSLAQLLGFSIANPTYSSIKNRFIRSDKTTASNIYNYLNVRTPDQKYILYYSYLFLITYMSQLALQTS
jgi:uncharacterized protein YydD (DUF2326 family)